MTEELTMGSAMSDQRLTGGVVVTGGASGIGRATVLACAERGARVAVLDLDEAGARAAADEATGRGAPSTVGIRCDVRDEVSVAEGIDAAHSGVGPLRMLVASAGIDRGGLVHELELGRWNDVIGTNLTGTFLVCKHVLARMVEHGQGGSIVCLSSPWAEVTAPGGASAYCASKGGISAFVRSIALDYAPFAIRANAVVPGATETPLMWVSVAPEDVPEVRRKTEAQLALGRLADPDDIAAGIAWLLSDQASYVTGSHLVIDGGLMARAGIDS
jgi:NAD(P)-dependent dehydrogenase (short-subunit alcohol dehydrogenase family)